MNWDGKKPKIITRGLLLELPGTGGLGAPELDLIIVTLQRASEYGWDCLCIYGERYAGQDIFVFDEDLKESVVLH